ncbi:hypothetical protein R6Q57_005967 [Mikania cordata]
MVKEADPGWTCETLVEGTKNSVRCNFCNFVSKGGITRHKDSADVSRCPKVPLDVKNLFKQSFEKKKQTKEAMNEIPHFDDVVDLDDDEEEISIQSKGKRLISSMEGNPILNETTNLEIGEVGRTDSNFQADSSNSAGKYDGVGVFEF